MKLSSSRAGAGACLSLATVIYIYKYSPTHKGPYIGQSNPKRGFADYTCQAAIGMHILCTFG